MNQPSETNEPDTEGAETFDDAPPEPAYVPDSEAPTVVVPLPDVTVADDTVADETVADDTAADETRVDTRDDTATGEATGPEFGEPALPVLAAESTETPDEDDEDDAAEADETVADPPDEDSTDPEDPTDPEERAEPPSPTGRDESSGEPPPPDRPVEHAEAAPEPSADVTVPEDPAPADETDTDAEDTDAEDTDAEDTPDGDTGETEPGETGEDGWGGPESVESVYGPLTGFYERLGAELSDASEDEAPVGWAPHVAALRAMREQRVAGDWEVLARFLVAPGTLAASEDLRLIRRGDGDEGDGDEGDGDESGGDGTVRALVKEAAAADGRALLVAPTPERAAELLRGLQDDPEVFSLLIETHPVPADADSVETQGLPPVTDEVIETPPVREHGAHGTVEFRPPAPPSAPSPAEPPAQAAESPAAVTRAEALPTPPTERPAASPQESSAPETASAPETYVRSAALRPVGEAWRQSWEAEVRLLRRGLMWLEQWPRDAATLKSVEAENLRRGEELEAEQAAMRRAIEAFRGTAAAAERAAAEAEAEAERLAAVQREAEEELAGPREEAQRLQALASEASAQASALTRAADASYARCLQIDERTKTAQAELQAARQTEASLSDQLARAREALPAAEEEARRLAQADADAAAEGHSAYYRLAAAESALAAVRRKMTLAQRMHVASPPSDLRSLRAEVKARTREADEAASKAREAKEAAENAERARQELAAFVRDGGARLAAAQEAQERLTSELAWLATERETAGAEHQEQARRASEAVERATQAGMRARAAAQTAQAIEDRVNAARSSREQALATASRARTDAQNAAARADETQEALERRTAEAAQEMSARASDLEDARRAEAHSREKVRETCGSDPVDDPGVVPEYQRRAMARIEELTGYLGGERTAARDVLLGTADVVVGTPAGIGLTVRDEEFDALVVADAGRLTDGEFLIGAVRSRRWILVGAPDEEPPAYREYADAPSDRLSTSPFGRAAAAAPHLFDAHPPEEGEAGTSQR